MQTSDKPTGTYPGRRELDLPVTIFEVMSRLSEEHGAINLGQGFPDDRGPADVLEAAAAALLEGWNQYPSMMGTPELRRAVAEHGRRFYGLDLDWKTETMVTSGATEALTACLLGLIEPGDEVVLFQPMYDSYLPIVRLAGGVPRFVTLTGPDWSFSRADLEAAFSAKTKLVVINDPLNPAAKVYTRAELELLAEFVLRFDAYAVCDEVYEHIVFDGRAHIPLMTLPGMRERCLKIGSAGKTFSLTGWKVGYVSAAPHLLQPVAKAHQFLTFTTPPNLQTAVAYGLGKDDAYFAGLAATLGAKRDRLSAGLAAAGLEVLPSAGTYFVTADIRATGFDGDDRAFCRWLTAEAGVAAIPVSAFYVENAPATVIRFCFSKSDAVLDEAVARLARRFRR
ncbi:aminotransferase [Azospirillum halopraeferens]|uniref:aminotransferase n=1 Tax=Azospirillum halopraeferens TaxID=34010 RepID=UPI00048AFFB9|nr:aminotransferase [Azospirillum halopraeferens]